MAPSKEVAVVGSNEIVSISHDQTMKASKALLSHIKKAAKESAEDPAAKKNLLADDDADETADTPVWLNLTTKRHITDKPRLQPGKIALPHSLHAGDETLSVCLITADPQRAYKDIVAGEEFPEDLRKRIGRVIGVTKLKAKYSQYEAQRKLYSEHDIFLGDERIINRLPKILGKTFYKTTTKRPIPVDLQAKVPKVNGKRAKPAKKTDGERAVNAGTPAQIAKEVSKAIDSALVSLVPGTNTAIRIGYASWTADQIADNVEAVAAALVEKWVPQKWRNVRSIHIKGPQTVALPIWVTDELWVDDKDVVADTEETKANISKKRKALAGEEPQAASPAAKKTKKVDSAGKHKPTSDDAKLDTQIAERKAKLRSAKARVSKATE
ncbi:ribosomal protein L1 [Cordyceps fumosorosea ARSEF 2679]|uniref:Ribosomal protein L1 n=1 Tax=Cordyceps fumosorosea (strain ARSEF 2679) TaxID=1081104 RepID=A0A167RKD7_CORFA|nr:ribosomal protein L1 [Cordyceps fumosorosea ARSEF 2679]OAA58682.1 ribosomal protein L1 [Cordyceps fumosorosea ARSEF 2679]